MCGTRELYGNLYVKGS